MHSSLRRAVLVFSFVYFAGAMGPALLAQSNSGVINGTVTDPAGAVIPKASVSIQNPVSEYFRNAITDSQGHFQFTNVPLNSYHLTASAPGFGSVAQDAYLTSAIPVEMKIALLVAGGTTTVTVTAEDLMQQDASFRTPVDRGLFDKLPLESQSSTLSSLVTLASPGVAADSNGLFHGLGDHASNSFSVDGQPITDQQSKVFSNQIPSNSIQSIEAIPGAPPAEYGGKTSLIINVTTRSGQGSTTPHGSVSSSYGSFGSGTGSFDIGYGGQNWGNFFELDGLNSGRFLDPPELSVFHDKGNELNFFDRVDRNFTQNQSIHLNLNYTRSWFQTPNAFDNLDVVNVTGGGTGSSPTFGVVGNTDQRAKIETYDVAPLYTRLVGNNAIFNFGAFVRKDSFHYYPSHNLLADLGPIQNETISQYRTLTNTGIRSDYSIQKNINNIKLGAVYQQTFLREHNTLGLINSTFNSPCIDANTNAVSGFTDPGRCAAAGLHPNDGSNLNANATTFNPDLLPYDLTRGGSQYLYFGLTDVKELALYIQDQIKAGNWILNLGMRGDLYNGLAKARQAEPRVAAAYSIKPTNMVLRVSYARTLETPFNENLVLSSSGCGNNILAPLLNCTPGVATTVTPGYRNEFHAGFQQAFWQKLCRQRRLCLEIHA